MKVLDSRQWYSITAVLQKCTVPYQETVNSGFLPIQQAIHGSYPGLDTKTFDAAFLVLNTNLVVSTF